MTAPETSPVPAARPERRAARAAAQRVYRAIKAQRAAERTTVEIFAERLIDVVSSTPFLLLHIVWFAIWIAWNNNSLGLRRFDPFPYGLLTMVVSLEAIFLSILVLIGQRREAAVAELREELTLQVSLRMEAEVTKTLQLVAGLYARMGYRFAQDQELEEMLRPLDIATIEEGLVEEMRAITARTASRRP
ncbi:MAG TPA: DUF1003 domain-containing protein [Gemmatimonadaceae bacterium]|nr:DUF1003 domain-containing protein [Gemmatimonadaceae bacterium]